MERYSAWGAIQPGLKILARFAHVLGAILILLRLFAPNFIYLVPKLIFQPGLKFVM